MAASTPTYKKHQSRQGKMTSIKDGAFRFYSNSWIQKRSVQYDAETAVSSVWWHVVMPFGVFFPQSGQKREEKNIHIQLQLFVVNFVLLRSDRGQMPHGGDAAHHEPIKRWRNENNLLYCTAEQEDIHGLQKPNGYFTKSMSQDTPLLQERICPCVMMSSGWDEVLSEWHVHRI